MADVLDAPAPAGDLSAASREAELIARQSRGTGDVLKARMPELVKGAGYALGNNAPLSDSMEIMTKAHQATLDLRTATWSGYNRRADVVKGMNGDFLSQRGYLKTALTAPSIGDQMQQLFSMLPGGGDALKSFTAGNLGIGTVSGLVPFDLLAPSRLIYPVYTVFRNKLPRPAGQGTARQAKVFTGVSGSQTGGQGIIDISIPELVQSGGSLAGTAWPLNLPPSGSQTEVDLNIPYRFFGLTESLSWLAQFAGQGFEDISALANLILLQEMMMGEEYQLLAGTSTNLSAPATPTLTGRVAGSNETAISTVGSTTYVTVTATNYFGETTASTAASLSPTTGQVVDVTIVPSLGAQSYNIYVGTSNGRTTLYRMATGVGGQRFTLQGTVPSSGANSPATDSGTGSNTRLEGLIPTLTGKSAATTVYPSGWQGGYYQPSVGTHLSFNALYTALDALWESVFTTPGAFRADPAEIVGDGGDIMRLSTDVISQGSATNYRLWLDQADVSGVRVGAAVSEFQNPITRSVLKLVVHPWMTQGTAMLMTYQLPQTWTNVANAWEMTCVQDYVSIAWPVIDATFRYSIFLYAALCGYAPYYSGILQGLQVSDTTPYQ